MAKKIGLPPAILFMEPSLIDMANQYPTTLEELAKTQGVGHGKANKYGKEFVETIKRYVDENNIIRPHTGYGIIDYVDNKPFNL